MEVRLGRGTFEIQISKIIFKGFFYFYIVLPACMPAGKKRHQISLKMTMIYHMLGIKFRTLGRTAAFLNPRAISPALYLLFYCFNIYLFLHRFYLHVVVCTMCTQCSQMLEEAIRFSRTGVRGEDI